MSGSMSHLLLLLQLLLQHTITQAIQVLQMKLQGLVTSTELKSSTAHCCYVRC